MTGDDNLSYVHGACDVPLIGSTIGDLLDYIAERCPDHEALVSCHQKLRYTYRQLQDACNRFARGLIACGVMKGDRVGIWSPNYAEWVITQFATAKIGAILVNINPAYRGPGTRIRSAAVGLLSAHYCAALQIVRLRRIAARDLPRIR